MRENAGKIRSRITPNTDTFYAMLCAIEKAEKTTSGSYVISISVSLVIWIVVCFFVKSHSTSLWVVTNCFLGNWGLLLNILGLLGLFRVAFDYFLGQFGFFWIAVGPCFSKYSLTTAYSKNILKISKKNVIEAVDFTIKLENIDMTLY